jgi:hypothetical protein
LIRLSTSTLRLLVLKEVKDKADDKAKRGEEAKGSASVRGVVVITVARVVALALSGGDARADEGHDEEDTVEDELGGGHHVALGLNLVTEEVCNEETTSPQPSDDMGSDLEGEGGRTTIAGAISHSGESNEGEEPENVSDDSLGSGHSGDAGLVVTSRGSGLLLLLLAVVIAIVSLGRGRENYNMRMVSTRSNVSVTSTAISTEKTTRSGILQ